MVAGKIEPTRNEHLIKQLLEFIPSASDQAREELLSFLSNKTCPIAISSTEAGASRDRHSGHTPRSSS